MWKEQCLTSLTLFFGWLVIIQTLRRKQFPTTIPVNAPPQLNNVASCCFANTWLQIVMSSDPMRSAMLPALDISHPDRSPCQPFDDFRSMMNKYEEMIRRKQPGVVDMSDIVCILRWIEAKMRTKTDRGYSYGQQICPLQFFQYIREQLEENGHGDHPILTELFSLGQIVSHRTCPCRPDTQVCVENCPDNMALSISHTNTSGCLLSDCINAHCILCKCRMSRNNDFGNWDDSSNGSNFFMMCRKWCTKTRMWRRKL